RSNAENRSVSLWCPSLLITLTIRRHQKIPPAVLTGWGSYTAEMMRALTT
ncbi:unnamed protein product, partial [Ectocarpus fasciculatus]